jgi:hypothetical protein
MSGTFDPSLDLQQIHSLPDEQWAAALDSVAPTFSQKLVDTTSEDTGTSWIDKALQLMTAVQMSDTQRRLLNVQIDRASKGLPPLDASQYSAGVSVGIAPETQNLLKWAVIGVGALVALSIFKPSRGR